VAAKEDTVAVEQEQTLLAMDTQVGVESLRAKATDAMGEAELHSAARFLAISATSQFRTARSLETL
jgi:hypothetical protein